MPDTGIRSDRAKTPPRHRIANVQHELTSNLPELIRRRNLRPRRIRELHRQCTHRTTHRSSVRGAPRHNTRTMQAAVRQTARTRDARCGSSPDDD
jgi:hypothetical protein